MNTQELLEAAATHCPEMVEKTASVMYLLDQLSPDHVQDVLEDFDVVSEVFTKRAAEALPTFKEDLLHHGKTALGIAITGAALTAIHAVGTDMYDAAKRGLTSGRNFNRVLKQNPELLEKYDKKDLKKVFDTVHRFGPEFTADPFLMERVLEAGMQSPDNIFGAVQNIIGARKNLVDAKSRQFSPVQYNANAFVRQDVENIKSRNFQEGENLKSQKFQGEENEKNRGTQREENQKARYTTEDQGEQNRQNARNLAAANLRNARNQSRSQARNQAAENLKNRAFQAGQSALQRDQASRLDQSKSKLTRSENEKNRTAMEARHTIDFQQKGQFNEDRYKRKVPR